MAEPHRVPPPRSEAELLARADVLAGRTLGEVATELALPVPATTRRGKGWTGTVIEHALGANAGSLPEPDFRLISVELKTIPIGPNRRPLESTYVCTVPLAGDAAPSWQDSNVRRKLARVLWIPFEGDRGIPLPERRVGAALLWSPSPEEESALANDWETLMDRVVLGEGRRDFGPRGGAPADSPESRECRGAAARNRSERRHGCRPCRADFTFGPASPPQFWLGTTSSEAAPQTDETCSKPPDFARTPARHTDSSLAPLVHEIALEIRLNRQGPRRSRSLVCCLANRLNLSSGLRHRDLGAMDRRRNVFTLRLPPAWPGMFISLGEMALDLLDQLPHATKTPLAYDIASQAGEESFNPIRPGTRHRCEVHLKPRMLVQPRLDLPMPVCAVPQA